MRGQGTDVLALTFQPGSRESRLHWPADIESNLEREADLASLPFNNRQAEAPGSAEAALGTRTRPSRVLAFFKSRIWGSRLHSLRMGLLLAEWVGRSAFVFVWRGFCLPMRVGSTITGSVAGLGASPPSPRALVVTVAPDVLRSSRKIS